MSLQSEYTKERTGRETVEWDEAFAIYEISGFECYIVDIYVRPGARKSGVASELAHLISKIARERGCKVLTGSVCPQTRGATDSLKVLLAYGFQLAKSEPNIIWFVKEL